MSGTEGNFESTKDDAVNMKSSKSGEHEGKVSEDADPAPQKARNFLFLENMMDITYSL